MNGFDNNKPQAPKGMRLAFGIFMVIVYLGVGFLFFNNFFHAMMSETTSYVIGTILVIYGIFRGWRLYKGY